MRWIHLFIVAGLTLSNTVFAKDVPYRLFDIVLGDIYQIGDASYSERTLPIKKFMLKKSPLNNGLDYYFQPEKNYSAFEYIERKVKDSNDPYSTSFRLLLLPVIPDSINSLEALKAFDLDWEVSLIQWSVASESGRHSYAWAMNLCQTFAVDLSIRPMVENLIEQHVYECIFKQDGRVFKVTNRVSKQVTLSFTDEIWEAKDDAVGNKLRKIEANEIRPY